jgi:large conductance mechanosensitive channel
VIQEFKDFINKGNLVDLAVAFILAGAFGILVKSFTDNIVGGILSYAGGDKAKDGIAKFKVGRISIGQFIADIINFLIIAFVMFLVVKAYNKMKAGAPAAPTTEEKLLTEIRDSLRR